MTGASAIALAANAAWAASNLHGSFAFRRALHDPRRAQLQILHNYIRRAAHTAFGREHHFDRITCCEDFRARVPVRNYDAHAPWIHRIAAGESNVLTPDPVTRLATSSGSTSACKLIPYTVRLQREFNRAIGPWIVDLYRSDATLAAGCAYWSVTPVAQPAGTHAAPQNPNAPPVGFEEDSAYLGGVRKRLVDAVMAVPSELRHLSDIPTFRYVTLRVLLARRDLRLISVWHPSFLELLLNDLPAHWPRLLRDIRHGTLSPPQSGSTGIPACDAARVRSSDSLPLRDPVLSGVRARLRPDARRADELAGLSPHELEAIWPHLRLLSCWADAHAAAPAQCLAERFPHVRLQPKGLLSTEAFVTLPFRGQHPLAVRSHFFEFLDDAGRPRLSDEIDAGAEYDVVVTTGGGLWRYRTGDRVRADAARVARTPSLTFVGRSDAVVDRFGEKLSDAFAAAVLQRLQSEFRITCRFAMLAPEPCTVPAGWRYTLYIECARDFPASAAAAAHLDRLLLENPHYAYCRSLGQLGSPSLFRIPHSAHQTYVTVQSSRGLRLGDIKPTALSSHTDWSTHFARTID